MSALFSKFMPHPRHLLIVVAIRFTHTCGCQTLHGSLSRNMPHHCIITTSRTTRRKSKNAEDGNLHSIVRQISAIGTRRELKVIDWRERNSWLLRDPCHLLHSYISRLNFTLSVDRTAYVHPRVWASMGVVNALVAPVIQETRHSQLTWRWREPRTHLLCRHYGRRSLWKRWKIDEYENCLPRRILSVHFFSCRRLWSLVYIKFQQNQP